ncbi:MAG: class A beta-lactamase-related serine hydrolase [Parvularculaceae bacterium]|nr:MAG: class A beta-lactamase-related serine hydrolase [Parvularculaceae bacterium]
MSDQPIVSGTYAPRYDAVARAMLANFQDYAELGVSFAAVLDGQTIVDIRAGWTTRKKQYPWADDTIACVYSSGKAVQSLLVARAVSSGALDYERPIADYWPEFGANGKQAITVAQGLSHQGGLCGFREEMAPEDWLDWDKVCTRLAGATPLWEPGTANGYHPQTAGLIGGELIRRTTGKSVGAHLRSEGRALFCGLGADEMARSAQMPKPPKPPDLGTINEFTSLAFLKPWSSPGKVSREAWMAAELPASNMHGNAKALAEIMHPFAVGGAAPMPEHVIDPDVVKAALAPRITGDDLVLPFRLTWAAGLMANGEGRFGPSPSAFGHAGFGGSCVMVDPDRRLSVAYVMNQMSPHLVGDPRAVRLISALYDCL